MNHRESQYSQIKKIYDKDKPSQDWLLNQNNSKTALMAHPGDQLKIVGFTYPD